MEDRITSIAPRRHHTGFLESLSLLIVGPRRFFENGVGAVPFPMLCSVPANDIDRGFLRRR
jgi:hypothetical protein